MKDGKNLIDDEAIAKLKSMVSEIDTCLFCTHLAAPDETTCRPMAVQNVCDQGNIWFFSNVDSEKNAQILQDKGVQLYFAHPGKQSYLVVHGEAKIIIDRAKTEELWTPLAKAWFKDGKDDAHISIIKVTPSSSYYWDTEGSRMVSFLKLVTSAITGTQPPTGSEGSLNIQTN